MLLKKVEITYVSPCLADPQKIRLKVRLSDDVTEIMLYLNATVTAAIYNHKASYLTLSRELPLITLYPQEITMIKVLNTTDAWQVIDGLQELINNIYARHGEFEPDFRRKRWPHPLQLYSWLPRLNCKKCDELHCLAFAVYSAGNRS